MKQTRITIDTSRRTVITRTRSLEDGPPPPGDSHEPSVSGAQHKSEPSGNAVSSQSPTREEFDCLLAYLSTDREEAGREYEAIRRRLIKLFSCRGCSSPEELADETINRVARKLGQGTEIWASQPSAYFYGFARNILMDYRRRSRREAVSLDLVDESVYCFASPFDIHECNRGRRRLEELLQTLESYIQELPLQYRDIVLKYYDEEPASTVEDRRLLAKSLGIPTSTLRIRMHRIRTKLKSRFRESPGGLEGLEG